jgi:hypothetical protein
VASRDLRVERLIIGWHISKPEVLEFEERCLLDFLIFENFENSISKLSYEEESMIPFSL